MADLKAIGSEKLTGDAKIQRIMEIARYGETTQNKDYHTSTLSFSKKAPNGVTYAIIQEKDGYYVKSGINESKLDYVDGVNNKRKNRFRSYSAALKRVNLMLKPINEEFNNGKATSLFEQCAPVMDEDMEYYENNNDMSAEMFEQDDEEEKFVLKVDEPADDMGGDDMDLDMEDDMGDEEMDMDVDMEDDMGDEEMDVEDEEVEDEEEMVGFMKPIQKLTGKLGQKLRDVEEELGSADIKYVLNSIISAVNLDNLDEEDREDVLDRFEEDDLEYGMEDDIDIEAGDDEFDMGDEEMDMDMGDEEMDMEMGDEEMDMEDEELAETDDSYSDDLTLESKISKTLKKYFKASKEEKILHERKIKKYIRGKLNETNLKNDSNPHTVEQELTIDRLIKEGAIKKYRGENKSGVLYFENKNRRPIGIDRRGKLVK